MSLIQVEETKPGFGGKHTFLQASGSLSTYFGILGKLECLTLSLSHGDGPSFTVIQSGLKGQWMSEARQCLVEEAWGGVGPFPVLLSTEHPQQRGELTVLECT